MPENHENFPPGDNRLNYEQRKKKRSEIPLDLSQAGVGAGATDKGNPEGSASGRRGKRLLVRNI